MGKAKVSVIIAVYGVERYMEKCAFIVWTNFG
jgi:hypothetical protein